MIPRSCAASSAVGDLFRDRQRFVDRDRATHDSLRQIVAGHQLHDERVDIARLLESVNDRDVWMVQRGQGAGFALKPCNTVRIGGECLRQDLDRHLAIELRITGSVDLPHAAFANLRRDHIRP